MPTFVTRSVSATVPATSANLGPGYDALGVALSMRDRVSAQVVDGADEILVTGESAATVPRDGTHLVHRAMRLAFEHMGCRTPALRLVCQNAIPHGRGLGSSSAAIVAGLALARALVEGGSHVMDDDSIFALAADIEGHPDNVAPAVFGGFTVAYADDGRFRATSVAIDPRVSAVVLVPPLAVETRAARALLRDVVPHADAARNVGRAALLVVALGRQPELLLAATEDHLHQDYRESAMPGTLALLRTLRGDGYPAVVSGAGPSVLVFTDAANQAAVASRAPAGWRAFRLSFTSEGVRLER